MPRRKRTWVVMADSACAQILANDGSSDKFSLVAGAFFENPSARRHTRELGRDRPARAIESVGGARHAIEPPVDWRREDRIAMAKKIGKFVEKAARDRKFDQVVLAAPPTMLGHLRAGLGRLGTERTVKELRKDLMKLPAAKLAAQLRQAVKA
jgi:protein required for attachment to host cells